MATRWLFMTAGESDTFIVRLLDDETVAEEWSTKITIADELGNAAVNVPRFTAKPTPATPRLEATAIPRPRSRPSSSWPT